MRVRAVLLAAALMLVPPGARAADLVVWWDRGFSVEEDGAVRELVAAFQSRTGKTVDLSFHVQWEMTRDLQAALDAGRPPDFAYGFWLFTTVPRWAHEGRLLDLTDAVDPYAA